MQTRSGAIAILLIILAGVLLFLVGAYVVGRTGTGSSSLQSSPASAEITEDAIVVTETDTVSNINADLTVDDFAEIDSELEAFDQSFR